MCTTVFLSCADDCIGRFDTSMLSQQTLMELFIFGFDNVENICGSRDDPRDVCTWEGVKCNTEGEVVGFTWSYMNDGEGGTGTIAFKFVPCTMTDISMCENALSGTLTLADLKDGMELLSLDYNNLSGPLSLNDLPRLMQRVNLSENSFTGEVSLTGLPRCLQALYLGRNQLSGAICLTSLPHTLRFLNLSENTFDGSLNLTRLPENIRSIVLCENMFSGEIDVRHLPKSLTELDVRKNRLCGTVCTPPGVHCWDGMVQTDRLFDGNTNLTVFGPYGRHEA
ncbi:Disease resistance protein [Perkinsela sp. CCAP 1560/4]|nr:Disease resistance protein [Perkinsela sp. CCAP 1560/4]|eukprot:KNH04637.1 Disease resistance protein [Perkinsela sp. CCAP 1560/4]